ncbi:MAG: hypothetical protein V2I46_14070 [Bacteroides sp.]|jgi:hypothetical protein|nr:hypothetical protein [Bacteroides sp.]
MKLKNKVWSMAMMLLLPTIPVSSQQVLQGSLTMWDKGEAKIAFYDMITGDMTELGQVDEAGKLEIVLSENYPAEVRAMAEEAQKNAPEGWKIRKNTVTSAFSCGSDELTVSNGEAEVMGLPELGLANSYGDPVYGVLMPASNRQVADWLYSYGEKDPNPGYYVRWYYVEETASVKGKCVVDYYTGHEEEFFTEEIVMDLDLTEGWNIIKTEISRVFTDQSGKIHPATFVHTRITELPADLQWFAMESAY